MQKFEEFSAMSGLKVNNMKSHMFFGATSALTKQFLQQSEDFKEGTLPVRYLGLPLVSTRLSIADCQVLIDKVHNRISSWAAKLLSYAGRVQLISSVILHLQVYWCGAFILPRKVQKTIEAACRNFLWGGNWESNSMALVSWNDVCTPKVEGGLGLKQLKAWNRAALSKKIWEICFKKDDLWVEWASTVLLKGKCIWRVSIPTDCSWSWKHILKTREVVRHCIRVMVGDGRTTSLFYDLWFGDSRLCDLIAEDDIGVWGADLTVHDWKHNSTWRIPDSFCRRYPTLAQQIQAQQLRTGEDTIQWTLSSGQFTISSCYEELRIPNPSVSWNNVVWSSFPRHNFLLWLVVKGRLKTKYFLARRGVQVDQTCCLCLASTESCPHLFFECPFSCAVWKSVLEKLNIRRMPHCWGREWIWVQRKCKGRSQDKKIDAAACSAAVYFIWKDRNLRIFQNQCNPVQTTLHCILDYLRCQFSL